MDDAVMQKVVVGLSAKEDFRVDEQCTAGFVGSGGLDVLAMPSLVAFVERVAYYLVQDALPTGYSSVGARIELKHLAPTPSGDDVCVRCEVTEVDGWRVVIRFEALDARQKVGEGRHEREVIDVASFLKKLAER